jgi:hypothetical protein
MQLRASLNSPTFNNLGRLAITQQLYKVNQISIINSCRNEEKRKEKLKDKTQKTVREANNKISTITKKYKVGTKTKML